MSNKQRAPRDPKLPKLPKLLDRKIYKTGQTRGADDDEIFQNRVARNSTVLIPYEYWKSASIYPEGETTFERGFIALFSPETYFETPDIEQKMAVNGLKLGENALVFYETRSDWRNYNPDNLGWTYANRRSAPLDGQYVARVSATTAIDGGEKIIRGYTSKPTKGAGIRVYEYASSVIIKKCRLQLEALFWLCKDALEVVTAQGMTVSGATKRKEHNKNECMKSTLLDMNQLQDKRLVSKNGTTMCPLCLEEISADGFFNRVAQAEGRTVHDLTITQLNLFHIDELRLGRYGHKPYNLGWGHHHCNVVVKDSGIDQTLIWMGQVIDRNIQEGYTLPK
ncbi:BstXI family restriction endonuclease [Candidatus Viridilinea mediisalina]|uniref:Restriction endonuclease n=1 Tax=Candidatus Viridilinea mediisalina TaxID=2024553 RepID=A0A2A6RJ18_9CHLR|nr:BstXI family restriction endonuclease [Candidatus Viridilinea mediisalina]PDW03067.1 restriction endonuclease [Candidatus Viridilinea mediisalina]